jgi:hypothetical protein
LGNAEIEPEQGEETVDDRSPDHCLYPQPPVGTQVFEINPGCCERNLKIQSPFSSASA